MNNTTKNKNLYSRLWDTKRPKSHKFWVTWEKFKTLIPEKNPKLLDIGCGIRPRIPIKNSHFLDLSKHALEILEEFGGICKCADAVNLPYKSNYFDFINASELLEHIEEDEKVLSEVNRVLKRRSHFSFSVPMQMKYWTKFDTKVNHARRYEPEELDEKIKNAGLKVKYFYANNPTKSSVMKTAATWLLSTAPNLALFLEENISLPISERIQKLSNRKWHTKNFIQKLKDASGVIVICQKV